jgi:hypothetical protein
MLVAIIRVYDHYTDAADAVQELRKVGVPEHDISLLTRDDRVTGAGKGAEIGAALGGLAGLLTGLGLVAIPGIGARHGDGVACGNGRGRSGGRSGRRRARGCVPGLSAHLGSVSGLPRSGFGAGTVSARVLAGRGRMDTIEAT